MLLDGLRQLEYRGYDSAGIATVHGGQLSHLRAEGKLINLTQRFEASGAAGSCGIGHTRWATHGKPRSATLTPTWMGPVSWLWFKTASSKTTAASGSDWRPVVFLSNPIPTPRSFLTSFPKS